MLPLDAIKIAHPHDLERGSLILRHAHYDRPAMFVCDFPWQGEERSPIKAVFDFRDRAGPPSAFVLRQMAVNLGPHLVVDDFQLRVDPTQILSPTRTEYPPGALCLVRDQWHFVVSVGQDIRFVSMAGEILPEYPDGEHTTGFAKWQVVANPKDGTEIAVFEQNLPLTPADT